MAENECLSRRRDKVISLLLHMSLLTVFGGSFSLQKSSETSEEKSGTTTTDQNGSKPVISNRKKTENIFVCRNHAIENERVEEVSLEQQPPCTSERYQQYFKSGMDFAKLDFPFQEECLKSLIDSDPDDFTLRLALVRRKYEDLKASKPRRHVVWYCRKGCGGIGDRTQQAITAFYLALAMNATFTIDMEFPVHWENFYLGLNSIYKTTSATGGFFDRFNFSTLYQRQYTNFSLGFYLAKHAQLIKPKVNSKWERHIVPNSSFA